MIIDKPLVDAIVNELNPLLEKNFWQSPAIPDTVMEISTYIRTHILINYDINPLDFQDKMTLHIKQLHGVIESLYLVSEEAPLHNKSLGMFN
ncbi:MAG: hypothetical protein JETCAE03_34540 [Ignavibacteriaceae bacterium]|jgi:hypothetical protein|nr:MAG: hypothetical protein JETCAE03_34540 [Ignavibacteriaceae bacterium]